MSSPHKRQKLQDILREDPYIVHRVSGSVDLLVSLFRDQPGALPNGPTTLSTPFLVIIDGLDECRGNKDQSRILSDIHGLVDKHRLPLRFFITSRPESHIHETFEEPDMTRVTEKFSILGNFVARDDVVRYLRDEFRRIQDSKTHKDVLQSVPKPWPSDRAIEQIAKKSEGYFIYAATVIKYVDEEYFSCLDRLDQILGTSVAHDDPEDTPFAELDRLYTSVLSTCPKSQLPHLKRALAFIGTAPSVTAIEVFLKLRPRQLNLALRGLRSIIRVDDHLESFHASFLDFLFDPARAKDYHVDLEQCYTSSFQHIFSLLTKSMPVLQASGFHDRLGVNCPNMPQN